MAEYGWQGAEESRRRRNPRKDESASAQPIDAAIWENVLRQTAEVGLFDAPLTPAERDALRNVAQRHQGQPLTLQPVATALVQAVILPQLPADASAAESWRQAFVEIAQTQLDDPSTCARLDRLWSQLQGEWP